MLHKKLCLVFLCFFIGCFSNPVPDKETASVYNYEGHIDTRTSALPESLSRWTIKGKLSSFKDPASPLVFLKLHDVKTSIFIEKESNLNYVKDKETPKEAKIIEQPFALKLNENEFNDFNLLFKPNEPLWSINMKRGIADFLKYEYEAPRILPNGELAPPKVPFQEVQEATLFGNCRVTYGRIISKDEFIYEKKMDFSNCTYESLQFESNKEPAPQPEGSPSSFHFNYSKEMRLKYEDGQTRKSLHSKAHIVYKTSPSAMYTLYSDQEQKLTFLEDKESEEKVDIAEYTVEKRLQYEFGDDKYLGRRIYETDPEKLVKKYMKHYDEFKKVFSYGPVNESTMTFEELHMHEALETMNIEGLKKLEEHLTTGEYKDDFDAGYFFLSLLSYMGTDDSVKYLTDFYKTDKVNANAGFSTRALVTFPQYMKHPTEELLKNMESLISNPDSQYKMAKHGAVFGFAAAVARTCNRKNTTKFWPKYIDLYHRKYLEGQTYEERMVYLLGLVNMAHCLEYDFIHSILTNSTEMSQLRVLAFNGFKKILQNQNHIDKMYDTYWPIVQKKSEPFDVRVAALDLLFSLNLTEEQFNSILGKYSEDLNEPEDVQLANYVITSLHSLQNTTGYSDPLGVLASEALKTTTIRPYPKAWATGLYRLSYTDSVPNVGAAFEAQLITDPKTNIVNTIKLSFSSFASTFNQGTYTLYLKFEGVSEVGYVMKWLGKNEATSLPHLLKLLKDNNFEIRTHDEVIHVDVVLFANNMAIYANHINKNDKNEFLQIVNDANDLLLSSNYITFPLYSIAHFPSVLGTPISITNYRVKVEKHNMKDELIHYRSSDNIETWLHVYNPLVDTRIAAYKFNINEMNVRLNISSNKDKGFPPSSWTWINEEESFTYNWNNNLGVSVDDENILHEYCEDCKAVREVPREDYTSWHNVFEIFGIDFPIEIYRHPNITSGEQYFGENFLEKLHQYNVDALPFVGPFLFLANLKSYKFWIRSDLSKGLIRSIPFGSEGEASKTEVNFDLWGNGRNGFRLSNDIDLKTVITVKTLEDKILSKVNLTANYFWSPNFPNEDETIRRGTRLVDVNLIYNAQNANESFKICGHGDIRFPKLRGDRLSLEPYEPTTGKIHFEYAKNVDDDNDCIPVYSADFTEEFSTTDNKGTAMEKRLQKDHEKCLSDSKDLKFTAPTKECKRVADKLTEYDTYKIYLELTKHMEDRNETVLPPNYSIFKYTRTDEDRLQTNIDFVRLIVDVVSAKNFAFEFYYPHMTVNPSWLAYSEDEAVTPQYARSTCTITPSTVQKFSGKYIPNQNKEWLAFGECLNVSRRGLNGHTIDDKHVGFTYYNDDDVVVATVKGGKPEVTLNGKPITEYYYAEDLSIQISFLDDKAIFIKESSREIYYNTEYVYIRVYSLYPQTLCGVCVEEK